ncbi:16S rRNA (guanine(966)-N(2))-methyltransferase RsmD [Alkalicoccus urumqiensis]|uniref:16S rRNA (Guanine(966)-N(2))-methyltransferase RsmD n=1 Tax=Alkalicoccus urumqiensis TaxID=1548213 RepID=A0A2P6MEL5_ALKUR|nr:16S rRNA (guanine(966)-N(2))-methyltransferase RsmD [Alkalicoccus urumqiensis]PRO64745.1 16S rRNA (guanine(966)-N(2))-methyltransferase RsmD [Alkalicoccus urumqiensis]
MRIISGKWKGRTVKAVPGSTTRPTTDKVREAFFHQIGPYFEGGSVLDLYGGSGVMGLEALSRGMETLVYVERDRSAFLVMKENIKKLGAEKESIEMYKTEAVRALKASGKRKQSFSFIYLDPPYEKQNLEKDLQTIQEYGLLEAGGLAACEHDSSFFLPDKTGGLVKIDTMTYGTIRIELFTQEDEL